ncbi:PIN domain-containing protein [Leptothrix sp. BB-4]
MIVVDSCGWLSYFAGDANANFFAEAIEDTQQVLVPGIVVYEVCRRLMHLYGPEMEARGFAFMSLARPAPADGALHRLAASAAVRYRLAMADAIIWQTAQTHGAALYTQDVDLQGLPGVVFRPKQPS